MRKATVIVYDLDGCVANAEHRFPLIRDDNRWDEYYDLCDKDTVNEELLALMSYTQRVFDSQVIVTGRVERIRDKTELWLKENNVAYDELYMRPDDNRQRNHHFKVDMATNLMSCYRIALWVDDNPAVSALRELGIPTLIVNTGTTWVDLDKKGM